MSLVFKGYDGFCYCPDCRVYLKVGSDDVFVDSAGAVRHVCGHRVRTKPRSNSRKKKSMLKYVDLSEVE